MSIPQFTPRITQGAARSVPNTRSFQYEGRGFSTEVMGKTQVRGTSQGQTVPTDECSVSIEEAHHKSPSLGFGSNVFQKFTVTDTDSTPNLEVSLHKSENGQGVVRIHNPGPEAGVQVDFPIANADDIDGAFFAPGAFGPPSGEMAVAINPKHPEDVYLFNEASEERWIITPHGVVNNG